MPWSTSIRRVSRAGHLPRQGPRDGDATLHEISDAIYGVCGLPREKLSEYHIPLTRWGGNPSTRYNWELGVDNAGSDWYFTNRGKPLARLSDSGYVANIDGNQVLARRRTRPCP